MARRPSRAASPRSFRRTKLFIATNLVLWLGIGAWYLFQPPVRQADVARLVRNAFDSHKRISAFDIVWDLCQLYAQDSSVAAVAPGDHAHLYGGTPASDRTVRVLANRGYLAGYSDELGNPLWVAYRMQDVAEIDAPERPDSFSTDARTSARVAPGDYTKSGYDRGHLAPNFAIASRYGAEAQEETFLMSNITPQRHALNAGVWKRLEHRIATNYPARFGEVWVIAGPVFGAAPGRMGRRVAIPEACFMVIVDELEGRIRAQVFVFPQDVPEDATFEPFRSSIDEVEARTGLDFLAELPDEAENTLEAQRTGRVW